MREVWLDRACRPSSWTGENEPRARGGVRSMGVKRGVLSALNGGVASSPCSELRGR